MDVLLAGFYTRSAFKDDFFSPSSPFFFRSAEQLKSVGSFEEERQQELNLRPLKHWANVLPLCRLMHLKLLGLIVFQSGKREV